MFDKSLYTKTKKFFDPTKSEACRKKDCNEEIKNLFSLNGTLIDGGICNTHMSERIFEIENHSDPLSVMHYLGIRDKNYSFIIWFGCACPIRKCHVMDESKELLKGN